MSEPKIKIGISGILYHNSQFLLGKRDPDDTAGNMWCTPGGGLDYGESFYAGLSREFFEEVRLDVTIKPGFSSVQEIVDSEEHGHVIMLFKEVELISQIQEPVAGDGLVEVAWLFWADILMLRVENRITDMTFQALMDYRAYQFAKTGGL